MSNPTSNAPMSGASTSFFQTWINALTKPNAQTYAGIAASPNAKARTAYLWIFVSFLIETFVVALVSGGTAVQNALAQQGVGGNIPGGALGITLITAVCGAPIFALIGTGFWAIGIAIYQWIAKMFGGRGTFDQLAYSIAAIQAPFILISTVFVLLGLIPFVGFCFSLLLDLAGLYALFLVIAAVKGVHQFGWGPAIGTVLIPTVVLLILCVCVVVVGAAAFGAAFSNALKSINPGTTP
jgi:Yip1 domain